MINEDCSKVAVMHFTDQPWSKSPQPNVERKRLELIGAVESGCVTSIVRYLPNSQFHSHGHPEGEEILVLEGTFEDEHGVYPEGSYLLNPEGFKHAPFSKDGCTLLVKLRQYPGASRSHIHLNYKNIDELEWSPIGSAGIVTSLVLYDDQVDNKHGFFEKVAILKFPSGAGVSSSAWLDPLLKWPEDDSNLLSEIFVVDGRGICVEMDEESLALSKYSWLRRPAKLARGGVITNRSESCVVLYVKIGKRMLPKS